MRLLYVPFVAGLLGCGEDRPLPTVPPRPFHERSGPAPLQLDRAVGRIQLPAGNLPEGVEVSERFTFAEALRQRPAGEFTHTTFQLPFPTHENERRFRGIGVHVLVRGEALPHSNVPEPQGGRGNWTFVNGVLHLFTRAPVAPADVVVLNPELARAVARLEVDRATTPAAEWVKYNLTFSDRSREGMILPAPAVAEWDTRLEAGSRFETFLAMVPAPLSLGASDGATAVLEIVAGGVTQEVGRQAVRAGGGWWPWSEPSFTRWELDLSAWAGQEVTLRLRTEPGASPLFDYVFLGSPVVFAAPTSPPRRVIVLAWDTTRPDRLSTYGYTRPTTPTLDAFAEQGTVFERAWAPAPRTRPSFRTATTGRYPLDAVGARNLGDVFDEAGFATAGIVANIHLNPRFSFDRGFDDWWLDTQAKADDQVDRALAWLRENRERDTYLFLHIMDPHLFYVPPAPFDSMFVSDPDPALPADFNRWQVDQWVRTGKLTDQRKEHIRGLYDGELRWTDSQVARLLEGLAELGGNDLVLFHTDHGEELWEHGGFEHNHTLHEEVVRAGLILRPPPGEPRVARVAEPVSLADMAPTLYDFAGIQQPPVSDGRSLRGLASGADPGGWNRPLPVGYLMYDREQWGVVYEGKKYLLDTGNGKETIYDLIADPGETKDVSGKVAHDPLIAALAEAHRAQVGHGWRVELQATRSQRIGLRLPKPALAAGVIDPDAEASVRANVEWGELPPRVPEDIASVSLSPDRTELWIEPGPHPVGKVYVLFGEYTDIDVAVLDAEGAARSEVHAPRRRFREGGDNLYFSPGIVIHTPPDEAARMGIARRLQEPSAAEEKSGPSNDAETCQLCALGYLSGASCEACEAPGH